MKKSHTEHMLSINYSFSFSFLCSTYFIHLNKVSNIWFQCFLHLNTIAYAYHILYSEFKTFYGWLSYLMIFKCLSTIIFFKVFFCLFPIFCCWKTNVKMGWELNVRLPEWMKRMKDYMKHSVVIRNLLLHNVNIQTAEKLVLTIQVWCKKFNGCVLLNYFYYFLFLPNENFRL